MPKSLTRPPRTFCNCNIFNTEQLKQTGINAIVWYLVNPLCVSSMCPTRRIPVDIVLAKEWTVQGAGKHGCRSRKRVVLISDTSILCW